MSPSTLVELLERSPSVSIARARLRPYRGTSGLAQAYFDRIVQLLGTNPEAARALADRWRLVAELGDDLSLAYRAKGASERLRGRWRESVASFQLAGTEAKTAVNKLAFQVGAVDSLARLGEIEEAVKLGRRLVRGLKRMEQDGLAGRCRLNVAAAYLWADRYAEAARWLEKARLELESAGFEAEAAGACMSLSTCMLHMSLPEFARDLSGQARSIYVRLGLEHMARLCESNLAQAHLQTGRADEALDILLRLREGYETSAIDAARVEEFLGDAYLRLNMPEEARNAYQAAARHPAMRVLPINQGNCHLGESEALRALGLGRTARAAAKRAIETYERLHNPTWAAIGRLAEAKTWLDLNRLDLAEELAESAIGVLRDSRAEFALAEANLIWAEIRIRQDKDAHPSLIEAEKRIRRRGMAGLEWRLYDLRAQSSLRGRLANYRKMAQSIAQTRAAVVSNYAKTRYLVDKADALGRYLDTLLQRPTPARIEEAIEVIRSTRAAALIDEAISAMPPRMAKARAAELASLREELNRSVARSHGVDGTRRLMGGHQGRSALARRWVELTHSIHISGLGERVDRSGNACVLTATSSHSYAIHRGQAKSLGSPAQLAHDLNWLRYALFEPLSDRTASPREITAELCRLRVRFESIWDRGGRFFPIAPDGAYWGVPWTALANVGEFRQEPVLCMSPGLGTGSETTSLGQSPDVVLWGSPRADLPQIEREIETVIGRFPKTLWLRTASQVRDFLEGGNADLIHVAGHARLDPQKPMFSFIELEGGRVFAAEIARSRIRTRLAVLSACDTGSLSTLNRLEPEGLVRAFLARGAEAAVASLWALDDETAAKFARPFYELLSCGQFIGIAISEARVRMKEEFAHPYFWAPMALFGGYRP